MKNYFETDLEGIKEKLKTFIKSQNEFKDYNFDGSGINLHLSLLAYVIQYQNLYLNFNSNELFPPTAQIKDNVYKHANTLNYIPKRKSASYVDVTLQRTSIVNIVIPKYSTWSLGGLNLTNLEDIIINDSFVKNVRLYEGIIETEFFYSNGSTNQEYELIEREAIDNDNLFIYVDDPDGLGGYVTSTDRWVCANFEDFNIADKAYYIQYFEKLKIQFDDGNLFKTPTVDQRIRVIYLKTNGAIVNGSSGIVTLISDILNGSELSITAVGGLKNGINEESIESIKKRAPLFYTTQNRAITENDYNILLTKYSKYDSFHSCIAWGGEKEYIDQNGKLLEITINKDVGHIYFSALKDDYTYLDQSEIDDLLFFMNKYKIITLFLKFMHPTFINIMSNVTVRYNSVLDLNLTSIETQINDFLKSNDGYKKHFYLSDVVRFVDNLQDIVYCVVDYSTSVTVYNEYHKVIRLQHSVVPGSINGIINSHNITDNGSVLRWNSIDVGEINYATGFITLNHDFGVESYNFNFEYVNKNALTFEKETFLKHSNITFNTI